MTEYRTNTRDVTPPPPVKRKPIYRTGIDPPPNRVGVYNMHGQRIGHVGVRAGVAVARRLLGGAPAEVGKVRGKTAWLAKGPGQAAVTRAANAKLTKSLRTDRGSAKR